jgi:hypothetical protein
MIIGRRAARLTTEGFRLKKDDPIERNQDDRFGMAQIGHVRLDGPESSALNTSATAFSASSGS